MRAKPAAFAVLDILGYGELMNREPDEVLAVIEELLRSSERNWAIQREINRFAHFSDSAAPHLNYLQFSDTLFIWLNSEPSAPLPFQRCEPTHTDRVLCGSLTIASFIAAGIPLRGAVGFGPTFLSTNPLFFTGRKLYDTMKFEKRQAWAGAALHDSAVMSMSIGNAELANTGPAQIVKEHLRADLLDGGLSFIRPLLVEHGIWFGVVCHRRNKQGRDRQH